MDGARVTKFDTPVKGTQVCVMYVDFQNLMGGAKTFSDAETTQSESLPLNPMSVLRGLRTLQVLAYNSNLGVMLNAKQKKHLANVGFQTYTGMDADAQALEGPESMDCGTQQCFIQTSEGLRPKIAQHVVTLRGDHEEVLGWLVFYISRDEDFDFDLAFMNYCDIESERARKRTGSMSRAALVAAVNKEYGAIKPYTSVEDWKRFFAFGYYGPTMTKAGFFHANGTKLDASANPLNHHKLFSIERALWWHNKIHKRHRQKIEYCVFSGMDNDNGGMGEDGTMDYTPDPEETFTLMYPEEAYDVPYEKMSPTVFFSLKIEELYADVGTNETKEGEEEDEGYYRGLGEDADIEDLVRIRQIRENLQTEAKVQSQFEGLRNLIATKQQKVDEWMEKQARRENGEIEEDEEDEDEEEAPEHTMEWCKGPECDRLYQAAMRTDEECPVSIAAYNWFINKPRGFSVVTPVTQDLCDERLTFFGNMLARDMLRIEEDVGILHLHVELMLLSTATLMIPDIEGDCDVMMHVMMSGPPACGKSNLQKQLMGMMIPKTYEEISVQTKMSMTVNQVFNGLLLVYDETPDIFKDEGDGSMLSQIKTIMTKGVIYVQQCHINPETGERVNIPTEAKRKCMLLLNTNDGEGAFPEAVVSRLAILWAPKRDRYGRDEVQEQFVFDSVPEKKERRDDYREECRKRQFIAICIHLWTRLGVIPRINTLIPSILIPKIKNIITAAGYRLDNRMNYRLMIQVKNLCIYDAINRVFFTETYFPKGTPFRFNHVLECAKYLVCRREHVWTALGMLMPSMVKPYVDQVLETMYDMIMLQSETGRYSKKKVPDSEFPVVDYDYYIVDTCEYTPDKYGNVLNEVSIMIENFMQTSCTERLSRNNIRDVLSWLRDSGNVKSYYTFETELKWKRRPSPVYLPKIKLKDTGRPRGVCILKEWLENMTDERGKLRLDSSMHGLLLKCIGGTMTDEYKDSGLKYITGLSLRSKGKPYVFDVFCGREYSRRVRVSEEAYRTKHINFFSDPVNGERLYEQYKNGEAEADAIRRELNTLEAELALHKETGIQNWSRDAEMYMYAYRVDTREEDEEESEYISRRWRSKQMEEEADFNEYVSVHLGPVLEEEDGEDVENGSFSETYKSLVDLGKQILGANGNHTRREYYLRGYAMKLARLTDEWRANQEKLVEQDQLKLGEAMTRAAREIEAEDDDMNIDPELEGYFKAVCGITWFKDVNAKSEKQAVSKRILSYNKDNLSLDDLAQQKWVEKLLLDKRPSFGMPKGAKFKFCNYPHSVVPKDFLRRCDIIRVLDIIRKEKMAKANNADDASSIGVISENSMNSLSSGELLSRITTKYKAEIESAQSRDKTSEEGLTLNERIIKAKNEIIERRRKRENENMSSSANDSNTASKRKKAKHGTQTTTTSSSSGAAQGKKREVTATIGDSKKVRITSFFEET